MAIIDDFARVMAAEKTMGTEPWWYYDGADESTFSLSVPLYIDYVVREGLYLEGHCVRALVEQNVTLLILNKPANGLSGPIARFDWHPLHSHENRGAVKGDWAWRRFKQTHEHPFDLNSALGWERMAKQNLPIALPVNESLNAFRDMLDNVGRRWSIVDIQRIPIPEWEPRLT